MPGRKNFMDNDEDRLPEGMKRIGYDERTQRYMFSDGNQLWLGEPGSFYGGTMKRAGRVPAANNANVQLQEDEEYFSDEDSDDPVPAYIKHEIQPKRPSKPTSLSTNEWGVPIASISKTDARPPDSTGSGAALKRRASRFKDAAASTVVATGVVRRLTGKKKPIRRVQQDSGETGETKHDAKAEEDSTRQANA